MFWNTFLETVIILEYFSGDFNNFGNKLEAVNEHTFSLQWQWIKEYLHEYTIVFQQVGICSKYSARKGLGHCVALFYKQMSINTPRVTNNPTL